MGTRSLTVMYEGKREIAVLYRQLDGYPSGHGRDLAGILAPGGKAVVMTNGISVGEKRETFNGEACMAASIIAALKDGVGGFYLHPGGTRDCGEEYVYEVRAPGKEPQVVVSEAAWTQHYAESKMDEPLKELKRPKKHPAKMIFTGGAAEFYKWCREQG